jgi:hypothetical protein
MTVEEMIAALATQDAKAHVIVCTEDGNVSEIDRVTLTEDPAEDPTEVWIVPSDD